ncbi:MAG: oligosaccharide flippase family protein [Nitrospirae bacterium]|nr:oligosaccharide flippase family protein [Nitrospirota bacterium]
MRQEILQLSKHTMIYGVASIIGRAVSFIMLPVYTRYLTPADYGVLELLSMTIDIIAMIAGIGITSTVFKYYSEYENIEEKNDVISTAIIMLIILSSITATLGFIFSNKLSQLVFGQIDNANYFMLFFIIYFLQSVNIIPLMFIRAMQNSKLFISISLIKLFMAVFFNICFLVLLKMGVTGILYSTLLADFIVGLYLVIHTFRRIGFRFSIYKSKKMVKFGYPFIFASLSSFVITYSDRYFLNVYSTLTIVGVYSLAYKFGFLMGYLTVGPFLQIWETQRFEIAKQDSALPIFKKVFLYLNILIISLSLIISLFVKDILTIMSAPSYHEAYKIVPIIIVAYILQAWTFYCNLGIYIKGRSKYMAIAYIISAISVTIFNFIFIPKYGAYGAAWATVAAFFILFFLTNIFSQRFFYIDYGWSKQLQMFILAVLIYLLSAAVEIQQIVISIGKNTILLLLFGILIYRFFLNEYEKSIIMQLIRNPMSIAKIVQ